ncbi:DUF2510 domain-containing protein [Mycobacterium eburneum]|nr:DUF2510 domain-containing protein [Mycobacterium eburneum]TDH48716.1 DUF2510 domain-containing protein [Mycobacterium eburneum]
MTTPPPEPGWYPDPSGAGNRYWDGNTWGPMAPTPTAPPKKKRRWPLVLAVLIAIVITLAKLGNHSSDSSPTPDEINATVIDVCQGSVKKQLKDPDSARFDGWKAWEVTHIDQPPKLEYHPDAGDKVWSAGGQVNAKNGFGGYVGDEAYGCDAIVSTNGNVHAEAYSLDAALENPDDNQGGS